MYHVKSDKRSRSSAKEFVKGLLICLDEKPLSAVTISDLYRATGISRATFYRLFDTPEDVLLYQFDQMAIAASECYQKDPTPFFDRFLENAIQLAMTYRDVLNAVIKINRQDLLYRYTDGMIQGFISNDGVLPQGLDEQEKAYVTSQISIGLASALIIWIENGCQETAVQLSHYMKLCSMVVYHLLSDTKDGV